ncbi:hypothetical protein G6M85_22510 [Agrobacterium tumefaciens]|uniref:hypothetical protein n=1 Tax=Agrobacterium tumefaciens TaxID=358 RepID=UPI0015742D99|nr:hypothetical protein [Agrobacterium tumefaciens]NTE68371.1 hypothetical protein [Agrobacterium tumefaciens]
MSKRKGQTNGNNTRVDERAGSTGTAVPDGLDAAGAHDAGVQTAGTPQSADGTALDATSLVDGSDGVDGAADGKGLNDGGRQELPELEAGEGATPGADTKTADTSSENVSGDIGAGSGSGSIENDGDASADGSADGGQDGPVSGEANDQAGSVGRGNSASGNDGREDDEGGAGPQSRLQRRNGRLYLRHADESDALTTDSVAGLSDDLLDVLELAGCATAENLIDMARIGSNFMEAIDDVRKLDGPFKDWAPMDDPAEIVHDLYNALEHAREKAATPALDPEVHCCPICDVPFKPDDVCATDIEEGTCHAECLAGSPVVDLNTGEPKAGPVDTFLYSDWIASDTASQTGDRPWWLTVPNFSKDIDPREISHSFAYDVFRGVHGSVETAGLVINGGSPAGEPSISFEAVSELVELVRRIGPRATPDVLAQHLVITKHRQSAELTKAEELALKAFAAILIDLDDYAAAEKKRLEDLAAEKPTPRPVPIDETNMEIVDGPMATH